jgi:hypothetical protein
VYHSIAQSEQENASRRDKIYNSFKPRASHETYCFLLLVRVRQIGFFFPVEPWSIGHSLFLFHAVNVCLNCVSYYSLEFNDSLRLRFMDLSSVHYIFWHESRGIGSEATRGTSCFLTHRSHEWIVNCRFSPHALLWDRWVKSAQPNYGNGRGGWIHGQRKPAGSRTWFPRCAVPFDVCWRNRHLLSGRLWPMTRRPWPLHESCCHASRRLVQKISNTLVVLTCCYCFFK